MSYVESVLERVKAQNPNEPEFHQAVTEVLNSLKAAIDANPQYEKAGLLERLVEPERIIMAAVKGMMPKNRLSKVQLDRLHIFAGEEHPHTPQKPQTFEITQVSQQGK